MIKELNYPFDAQYVLSKKKKLRKELLANTEGMIPKKIAILGGSTTNDIMLVMELFLLNNGIIPTFYESEYNRYYQDAMFENKELEEFAPDVIYIHTSNRNITAYPTLASSREEVEEMLKAEVEKFSGMWKHLKETYKCPIIQNNFDYPYYRLMGNKDAYDFHGHTYFVNRLNMAFAEFAAGFEGLYICDLNYISADYGLKAWAEPFYWYMYKYALAVPAIPYLSFNVANIIKSLFGKNKKGFVLDLDNTLWGGVIGDDGVDNIALGPEESEGQVYLEFQRYIKEHKQLGIILNVDSKNDYENAISGLNHPDSELKPDEFIEIKANWDPKDRNFAQIAASLNLLPESLVFVDDNPAERAIVTGQLPGVCAPEMTKAEDYIGIIDRSGFFEVTNLSKDDLKRNAMYKENALRASLQASFENYEDYLLSLEMKATIASFAPLYMARIAQLTNKSNQFNLTTKRFTQEEIESVAANDSFITLYGKLEDKFGDNGLVSVVIGRLDGDTCHIDLWLMSCRVLKRDMEVAMMDELVKVCKARKIKKLVGHYYPTAKNHMVEQFYDGFGFELVKTDADGNKEYLQLVDDYVCKNKVIDLKTEE